MNQIDRQKVEDIFNAALDLPVDRRARFLSEECGDDECLREEIESLLASHKEGFLEEDISVKALQLLRGSLLTGVVIKNRYKIIELIGTGGMGEVYLAEDTTMKRKVALKALAEKFSQDKVRLKNFEKEARTASQLSHQNILTTYDLVNEGGTSFIITEFIEGETLRKKLESKPLDLPTTLRITLELASALEAAHRKGVVHSDIKPENIIIDDDGHVKILDFGIAKLTEREPSEVEIDVPISSQAVTAYGFGTPNYMSPEQINREEVDARTDIWSLGVCLYEMLTGKQPFSGKNRIQTFASILKDEPHLPVVNIPPGLNDIAQKALQKNRDDRYQIINEFRSDIENLGREPNKNLPNSKLGMDTFEEWARTYGKTISQTLLYCASLSFLISLAVTIYLSDLFRTDITAAAKVAQAVGSIFHLILIGIAFGFFWKNPGPKGFRPIENDIENGRLKPRITYSTGYEKGSDWKQARDIAKAALKNYRESYVGLLIAWVLLYLCVFVSVFNDRNLVTSLFIQANNFNTLCIWLCFRILSEPITIENKAQDDKGIIITGSLKGQIGLLLTTFAVMVSWFVLELSFQEPEGIHRVSKLVSGVFGGVAMALFVGRFQSKLLKSPGRLVVVLYFYTVIQALFIFFGEKSSEMLVAFIIQAALFLKCLLILYMFWLFQSGRLLFYLVRVRRASAQVDSEWQNFREVLQLDSRER